MALWSGWGGKNKPYIAAANPQVITELCEALEEAVEMAEFYANASYYPDNGEEARAFLEKWGKK